MPAVRCFTERAEWNGIGDLYRFNAAEVAGAFVSTTSLYALDAAHRVIANGINAYLATDDGAGLWQDNFTALNLIDTDTGSSTPVATTGDFLGQLDAIDGEVFADITDFGTNQSAVYKGVVPEPAGGRAAGRRAGHDVVAPAARRLREGARVKVPAALLFLALGNGPRIRRAVLRRPRGSRARMRFQSTGCPDLRLGHRRDFVAARPRG